MEVQTENFVPRNLNEIFKDDPNWVPSEEFPNGDLGLTDDGKMSATAAAAIAAADEEEF